MISKFLDAVFEFLDAVFGCWHNHYSFPLTVRGRSRNQAAALTGTYVVCLDCGKELPYDWQAMKVVSPWERREGVRSLATKHAA
jgi:hypothetical protein